jgi:quercetin dioxygenase-like cupin family protein
VRRRADGREAEYNRSHPRHEPIVPQGARIEPRAVATVQIDNADVRVTEWRFAPGATTGPHRHEYPYVVIPLASGRLELTGAASTTTAELATGRAYFRPAGAEHDVKNANPFEFVFVEVELKRAQ